MLLSQCRSYQCYAKYTTMTMEALPQDLADFLVTKNFDPEYFDAQGQPAEAGDAKTMKFDYVAGTGKNYGTAVCVIADDELNLFYGDNLGRGMDPEDKDEWFGFLEQLSNKAASHSATWSPRDINQLKHTLAGIAAIKEGLFEGYYGNRRVSYMGEQTQARLVINHNRTLGEDDKRYRYVESLFIETADQERFRLPFKSLAGGRAMLEHVRQGGRPYDVRGNHISEIVSEMAVLSRFNRAQHSRVFEGVTQELVESAKQYYQNLQETVKHLGSTRGYQAYFESWAPDQVGEAESLVENLRNMFVEQTLDARIEAALPTLAKIQQQGMNMKEAQIFENWINNLSEGTWALPETPEQQEKLNQLMSGELIVGPDATNATEQLYDIVGDDELFDILNDLADRSEGRANIWDDSDVQRRLAELGVQTPQSTEAEPADVAQDEAPEVKEGDMAEALPSKRGGKNRLRDALEDDPDMMGYHAIAALYGNQMWDNDAMGDLVNDLEQANPTPEELQYIILNAELPGRLKSIRFTNTDDVQFGHMDEGYQLDEGAVETITALVKKIPGIGKYYQMAQQYKPQLIEILKTSKSGKEVKQKMEQLAASQSATVSESGMLKQLGGLAVGGGSILSAMWMNAMGLIDGVLAHAAAGEVGGAVASGSILGLIPVTLMLFAAMLMFKGSKQSSDEKAQAFQAQRLQGVVEGDNQSTFVEDRELSTMLKYAGVPIREGVLNDDTRNTWDHLLDRFRHEVEQFKQGGDIDSDLYDAVFDYYDQHGAMPYRVRNAKDGTASQWVSDRLADDLGIKENLISPMIMPVSEGSCNMTMEGEYCPEHGLMECGSMEEDGGAVGMPYSMGEAQAPQDPINSNSAMTGSYYEGKETDIQEGDALLARIKSLALLR
jgi:hypothetical protein